LAKHGWSAQESAQSRFWMAWLVWLNPRVETMGFYPQVWRNHDGYR
jgi:hypothetical protein